MERNRSETALRCLEIAVHPNTNDEEVIAAINGFRRTVNGAPLRQLCREFAGDGSEHNGAIKDKLDRANYENLALRRKIEEIENSRAAILGRLQETELRARDIGAQLLMAEHRADTAERRLAEFQGAYGRISGGLRDENTGLRRALDEAKRSTAVPAPPEAPRAFQEVLNAARHQPNSAQASPPTTISTRPWTA